LADRQTAIDSAGCNEQWEFDQSGLMRRREASINDAIAENDRRFHWPAAGGCAGTGREPVLMGAPRCAVTPCSGS